MKLEKLKLTDIDKVSDFVKFNKNLVLDFDNVITTEFKNLLKNFATSRAKIFENFACYVLKDENKEIKSVLVFDGNKEIKVLVYDKIVDNSELVIIFDQLKNLIKAEKGFFLTAKVNENNILLFNNAGFKSVSFVKTTEETNKYDSYYFLVRKEFEKSL